MTYLPSFTNETYIPDPLVWTDTGVAGLFQIGSILRIGSTLYSFGGYVGAAFTNKIWTTAWSSPTSWAESASVLPGTPAGSLRTAIIDGYIYAFGDTNGGSQFIWKAPVSNPLDWSDTGSTLPTIRINSQVAIINGNIYIFNGYNGGALSSYSVASTSAPLTWSNVTPTVSTACYEAGIAVIDGYGVICGGLPNNTSIGKNSINAAGTLNFDETLGAVLLTAVDKSPSIWHVGNNCWVMGFHGTKYVLKTDKTFSSNSNSYFDVLPKTMDYDPNNSWIGQDGYMFIITSTNIYRSGRTKVYSESPPADGNNRSLLARTTQGIPTSVTSSCRLGFKSWLTNRTDLIP